MENLCFWEKLHENGPKIAGRLVNLDIIIYMICVICQPRNDVINDDAADADVDDVEEVNV